MDYAEFLPNMVSDLYLWRARKGSLVTRRFGRPETWENLVRAARAKPRQRTLLFSRFPQLLLPFALVYPHRLTPDLLRRCERLLEDIA